MKADSVQKTAILTPFELYEFVRMHFGLKNAAKMFQRLMDSATQSLPGVYFYLDNVLEASKSKVEHLRQLRALCRA